MLEVRLICKFEIQFNGEPITLSTRASQSLFAYLILTAGTQHRREKLAGMFWPDLSEQKARTYLRQELWRIRKAISTKTKTEYLDSDDLVISFRKTSDYSLDVDILKKLDDQASAHERMDTLSVYQGELLPGFYEDWVSEEREHIHSIFEKRMGQLLDILETERHWQEILDWAERWISYSPTAELAYQHLMQAYKSLGEQDKVVSTYERCVQTLLKLDLEPSEQTRALLVKRSPKINIPIPLTSFIGRVTEIKEVAALLSKSRLVTLTGSGGVGKTRLAIQVVSDVLDQFPDGVWFLDLAPLSNPTLVPNTLANVLGLRESGEVPITNLLVNYFHSRTALVILDNCEHLIDSCAQLIHLLLSSCEGLWVLATSREALRISGEISYRVPSLVIPKQDIRFDPDELLKMESIRLFGERVLLVLPSFAINSENAAVIAKICTRLDGIPLAIELAAARTNVLQPNQILQALDDRFSLLTLGLRSALPRHQTLHAMIEWSYDLLSKKERLLFGRLAVFAKSWTFNAAEKICVGNGIQVSEVLDLLSQLINKSMILVENKEHQTRYYMLETIHQFARIRMIESGEEETLHDLHLQYFLQLSEQAESALKGPSQVEWHVCLSDERDNIRVALEWADKTEIEAGLYIAGRLYRFWESIDMQEGAHWLAGFIRKPEANAYLLARAKALHGLGRILCSMNKYILARSIADECLDLFKACGDRQGEIDGLLLLGYIRWALDYVRDTELHEQALALAESLGDIWRQASALYQLGWNYSGEQQLAYWEKAILLMYQTGDLRSLAGMLNTFGAYSMLNGNLERAQERLDEVARLNDELKDKVIGSDLLDARARIAMLREDYSRARIFLQEELKITEELGARMNSLWCRSQLGYLSLREGDLSVACKMFLETAQNFQKDRVVIGTVFNLEGMADLFIKVGKPKLAARLIGWADATRAKFGDPRPLVEQTDINKIIVVCIEKMGESEFSKQYQVGNNMTLDEAVSYAVENV